MERHRSVSVVFDVVERLVHFLWEVSRRGVDELVGTFERGDFLVARVEVSVGRVHEILVLLFIFDVHIGVEHAVGGHDGHVLMFGVGVDDVAAPS